MELSAMERTNHSFNSNHCTSINEHFDQPGTGCKNGEKDKNRYNHTRYECLPTIKIYTGTVSAWNAGKIVKQMLDHHRRIYPH